MRPVPSAILATLGAPLGSLWVLWQEMRLRSKGSPLTPEIQKWAVAQGVCDVSEIRLAYAKIIPLPAPMFMRRIFGKWGFPTTDIAGLALRRGIYLEEGTSLNGSVIRHELIHTRQYQEAGSVRRFLRRYLYECLTEGYYECALEREARQDSIRNSPSETPKSLTSN